MRNFGAKNIGNNIGKIVYRKYCTSWFHLQRCSATWTRNIVLYQGSSVSSVAWKINVDTWSQLNDIATLNLYDMPAKHVMTILWITGAAPGPTHRLYQYHPIHTACQPLLHTLWYTDLKRWPNVDNLPAMCDSHIIHNTVCCIILQTKQP